MEEKDKDEKTEKPLHSRIIEETEKSIETILNDGITKEDVKILSELVDIHKDIIEERKEINNMNYGNYGGRRAGYDSYGRGYGNYGDGSYGEYGNYGRGNYGARGRDMRYRGDDYMDRMSNEYGRYMETRERYGAGEESDKAFHFMAKALGEYLDFLHEEADTPQKKQMLNETLQRSMM